MGEAKRRGTREQRIAQAVECKSIVEAQPEVQRVQPTKQVRSSDLNKALVMLAVAATLTPTRRLK